MLEKKGRRDKVIVKTLHLKQVVTLPPPLKKGDVHSKALLLFKVMFVQQFPV
ncbi:protein of unknown function [Methylotuvimicrobium alcaliphilum 20Z]|uniref:Uncharacterized protein n=1 Tax=Methylotuvimicrobium alcaliphilum (strain DSM 19304 / NCIMB 14124 / VKM B-2133 / 20Z) TaxID=1091494 RepID=G4SWJ6_META2|nr:protein of unknown function [Methylotuvimicrobium alcaliphilum 20Z]